MSLVNFMAKYRFYNNTMVNGNDKAENRLSVNLRCHIYKYIDVMQLINKVSKLSKLDYKILPMSKIL